MIFHKITEGWVVQRFNDAGEFMDQEFHAGEQVDFESEDGTILMGEDMPLGGTEYHPFTMENNTNKPRHYFRQR
jgi:hypothetical protein